MNKKNSTACDERYKEWISRHLDGDLNEEETAELQAHFKECDDCFRYYVRLNKIKHALEALPTEDWTDAWTEETVKKFKKEKWKKFDLKRVIWLSAAVLVFAVFAVSFVQQLFLTDNRSSSDYGAVGNSATESSGLVTNDGSKSSDASSVGSETTPSSDQTPSLTTGLDPTKIIYSGSVSLYTGDLKKTIDGITAYVQSIGGFAESSYYSLNNDAYYDYTSYGSVTVRVPVDQYETAMQTLESYGEVTSSYTYSENVTQSYRDVQSELANYRLQETRLNELMKQATSVSDMLAVETELNRVRTEIDRRESIMQNYDNLISYSTISISLYEEDISSADINSPFGNLWKDIKAAFVKSVNIFLTAIEKLILVVFYLLPFAILAAIVVGIVYLVRKKKGLIVPKTKNKDTAETSASSEDSTEETKE